MNFPRCKCGLKWEEHGHGLMSHISRPWRSGIIWYNRSRVLKTLKRLPENVLI